MDVSIARLGCFWFLFNRARGCENMFVGLVDLLTWFDLRRKLIITHRYQKGASAKTIPRVLQIVAYCHFTTAQLLLDLE